MTATGCLASLDRRENSLALAKVRYISLDNQNSGATFQKFSMTTLNSLLNENNSLRPAKNSLRPGKKLPARANAIARLSSVCAAFSRAASENLAKIPCQQGINPHSGE